MMQPATTLIVKKLQELVRGRVAVDEKSLKIFSRDQSIYELEPRAVVLPEDPEDVGRLVEFAAKEAIPLTPRGGGSGTAGSALGRGLVIALPENEFWGKISDFSTAQNSARVSANAGVYHNDLQAFLKQRGFFLPADVTSANISRISGNIATKASGPHALKHGAIDRFLEHVEFFTAQGEFVETADETTIPERFKQKLEDLGQRLRADESARKFLESRKGFKTSSGYNLFAFLGSLPIGQLIAQLFAGSVGTLGVITRAVLRAEAYEHERAAMLASFADLAEAGRVVHSLREKNVAAIELISRETLRILREQSGLSGFFPAKNAHLLMVEMTGPECRDRIEKLAVLLQQDGRGMSPPAIAANEEEIEELWTARKQILWLVQNPKPGLRALAVVNDVGVPPVHLAAFITDVEKIFKDHGLISLMYGHAGEGNLHLRPLFDMALPDLRGRIKRLADEVYATVFRYGGTVTAEHGMGRLRAPYLKQEWGEQLYNYMREVKSIFDPQDLFNPGVMFSNAPITDDMRPDLLEP